MLNKISEAGTLLQMVCHERAKTAGWWQNIYTGTAFDPRTKVPEKLMLIVSEVAEAMEGHRKGLMDEKLPHREMLEVELADAVIRIFDLAGALEFSLGAAIEEKLAYNASRKDHTIEHRKSSGGKLY